MRSHGEVITYHITGDQLNEARKGSRCDLRDKPKSRQKNYVWPTVRELKK